MGNYLQSQAYLLEGLRLAEQLNDEPAMSRTLNNLGNLYVEQMDNEQALVKAFGTKYTSYQASKPILIPFTKGLSKNKPTGELKEKLA